MRVVIFSHSLLSDWNHGNAHFLRGVATELLERGHEVAAYEPEGSESLRALLADAGEEALRRFGEVYPALSRRIHRFPPDLDLDPALDGADLVLVHEWSDPALVGRIGAHRRRTKGYTLFFHDTHHRAATAPHQMAGYDLSGYDGVLAFGSVIRDLYLQRRWCTRAWTWHEAADVRVFHPRPAPADGDLVWIGNWGDAERGEELSGFFLEPAAELGLVARAHGVQYPTGARERLAAAGIEYAGWVANHDVPAVFGRYRVTVHVPRRPYARALPGIPTIRPFEALACGIPLVSAPWDDVEGLFRPSLDYLVVRDGREMREALCAVLHDESLARGLAENGLRTILSRHTCAHRVEELLSIHSSVRGATA